jgi:hypothetical protein
MTFNVMTWLHSAKAVAIATGEYISRYPDARVYDVTVTPLGAAPRADDGTVAVGRRDLVDRFEF